MMEYCENMGIGQKTPKHIVHAVRGAGTIRIYTITPENLLD